MGCNVDFIAGDTGSKLVATCTDNDTDALIDLTGKTTTLLYRIEGGTLQTKNMTITNAVGAVTEYSFLAGELIQGVIKGFVRVIGSGGNFITQVCAFELTIGAAP